MGLLLICVTANAADRPNVVLIVADDLGYGDVGVYGKRVGGELNAEISAHLEAYAPSVKRLAELEVQAQASFWRLKRKFAGVG